VRTMTIASMGEDDHIRSGTPAPSLDALKCSSRR